MAQFVGTWNLDHAKNLEALFNKLGVTEVKKEHLENHKGSVTFTLDGNKMTMKIDSPIKKSEITFTFGEEFDDESFTGRKVRSKYIKDSESKITQIQTSPEHVVHIVREVHGDKMTTTSTVGDVTAVLTFHKVTH